MGWHVILSLTQVKLSVQDYTCRFDLLVVCAKVVETDAQSLGRYIPGL